MKNFFLTVLVIVCSCSAPNEAKDILGREKMTQVMIEIHLLEAKINKTKIEPRDSVQAVYEHYEKLLFDDLGITQDEYERSFNFYVDNPNEFEKIYSAVVDSLMAREKLNK